MTVLMPVICCMIASPTPTTSAAFTAGSNSSRQAPGFSSSTLSSISSSSLSIVSGSSTRIFASVARAAYLSPCMTSQRGLCGIRSIPKPSASAGTMPSPSIQRQPSIPSKARLTR